MCLTCTHITLRTLRLLGRSLTPLNPSIPVSSTSVWGQQQELRPKCPSAVLPVSPILKGALDKFEQDFQTANLPEGKFINLHPTPPSTTTAGVGWVNHVFEDKFQEMNTDFAKAISRLSTLEFP